MSLRTIIEKSGYQALWRIHYIIKIGKQQQISSTRFRIMVTRLWMIEAKFLQYA